MSEIFMYISQKRRVKKLEKQLADLKRVLSEKDREIQRLKLQLEELSRREKPDGN